MVKVLSAVVNTNFIEIQYYTLKKYFKGPYEFIIFNDAKSYPDLTNDGDTTIRQKINDLCNQLQIKCIQIPNENHREQRNASIRCADSMNFMLKFQLENPDQYLILDSDMILISDFDISKYQKYDCAIILQERFSNMNTRYHYIWHGICYFDILRMKNKELLDWNLMENNLGLSDTGGMMMEWLYKSISDPKILSCDEIRRQKKSSFPLENIYILYHLSSLSWDLTELPEVLKENQKIINFIESDPRNINQKFFCEIYDDVFLHYRAGSNWMRNGMKFHYQLSDKLKQSILD